MMAHVQTAVSFSEVELCGLCINTQVSSLPSVLTQRVGLEGLGEGRMEDCSLDPSSLLCKVTILPPTLYELRTVR